MKTKTNKPKQNNKKPPLINLQKEQWKNIHVNKLMQEKAACDMLLNKLHLQFNAKLRRTFSNTFHFRNTF